MKCMSKSKTSLVPGIMAVVVMSFSFGESLTMGTSLGEPWGDVPASLAESVGDAARSGCTSAGEVLDELGTERSFSAEVARGALGCEGAATNSCCANEDDS